MKKNKEIEIQKIENPKRNVVIIALRNEDGKILMVRTKKLSHHWQPIGGGIDNNETPLEAIIREVAEETSIKLNYYDIVEVIRVPYDFGEGTVYCYDTKKIITKEMLEIDKDEMAEYKWFTLKEIQALPMFPATSKFINKLSK